jgi:3-phenylpropionate/cinnamic acid dioxygenase small subunit
MANHDIAAARDLVVREGWLLDQRNWDEWLNLYLEDAEYWVPCWKSEYDLTDDPVSQVSLIYYAGKSGLEDRVYRIRTERSLASTPLPRTSHLVTVTDVRLQGDDTLCVHSNWATFSCKQDQSHHFFGNQIHLLKQTAAGLRIAKRKIIVMNDRIPSLLDIYSV